MNAWVFQANPDFYRVDAALKAFSEHNWLVNQHAKHIVTGDEVFIYRCGENAAIVAVGTVLCDPAPLVVPPDEQKYQVEPLKFDGPRTRVRIRTQRVEPAVPRYQLLKDPRLCSVAVFKGLTGTNFALSADAAAALQRLIDARLPGGTQV